MNAGDEYTYTLRITHITYVISTQDSSDENVTKIL